MDDTYEGAVYADAHGVEGPTLPRTLHFIPNRRRTKTVGGRFQSGQARPQETTFSAGLHDMSRHVSQGIRRLYVSASWGARVVEVNAHHGR